MSDKFNRDPLHFLDSIQESFGGVQSIPTTALIAAGALLSFLLFVILIHYLLQYKHKIRKRLLSFYFQSQESQRKFKRFTHNRPIVFKILGQNESAYRTHTADISSGGMFIEAPLAFEKGMKINFKLKPSEKEEVRGIGEVMWVQKKSTHENLLGAGIQIISMSALDRQLLNEFLGSFKK